MRRTWFTTTNKVHHVFSFTPLVLSVKFSYIFFITWTQREIETTKMNENSKPRVNNLWNLLPIVKPIASDVRRTMTKAIYMAINEIRNEFFLFQFSIRASFFTSAIFDFD